MHATARVKRLVVYQQCQYQLSRTAIENLTTKRLINPGCSTITSIGTINARAPNKVRAVLLTILSLSISASAVCGNFLEKTWERHHVACECMSDRERSSATALSSGSSDFDAISMTARMRPYLSLRRGRSNGPNSRFWIERFCHVS